MITIGISTISTRINTIKLPKYDKSINYIIIHQNPKNLSEETKKNIIQRDDVQYFEFLESGLSKSRNFAIKKCTTEFLSIMDDDVEIKIEGIKNAVNIMKKESIDIATCQYSTPQGIIKKYKNHAFSHSFISAAKISSIEIIIKIPRILNKNLFFDEKFGLGSKYPSGEEFIFATDAIKFNLNIKYIPILTCIHPPISSGDDFFSTEDKILAKKHMFQRVYKRLYPLLLMAFIIKKSKVLINNKKFLYFIRTILRGVAA